MTNRLSSRVKYLKMVLNTLGFNQAQKALTLMIEEMCSEKGFKRHDGTHYYLHLVDVTQKLINFGVRDENTIVTAILHDAIEDVNWITYEYIEREYGKTVADDVLTVTKDPNVDYKTDKDALVRYLQKCEEKLSTALVKSADRIHNFNTLGNASRDKQLRVALETEEYFLPMFKTCRNEYPEHANFFYQAKTEIEPHLLKIKESHEVEQKLLAEIERLKEQVQPTN